MIAQIDRRYDGEDRALELVWFLDASEAQNRAFFGELDAFRASHRRPKWDIALE